MKNVVTRSLSGLVYIAVIVGAILCGWQTFFALTSIFAIIGLVEYERITILKDHTSSLSWPILALDMASTLVIVLAPIIAVLSGYLNPVTQVGLLLALLIARIVAAVFDKGEHALSNAARSVLGVCYIGIALASLNLIYVLDGHQSAIFVLLMFVLIWLNDTGAYCVGSTMGKHRLCERLSPKKSWEGFWGGLIFCALFGIVSYYLFNTIRLSLTAWILGGIVASVFATFGDLFESMMKRTAGVKDSGNIIPGHGGILDRIDSLLLVAPAMLVFLIICEHLGWCFI